MLQLEPNVPMPTPNHIKRKILIKNKRLKPEVEKRQLELLNSGKLIDISEANDDQNIVEGEDPDEAVAQASQPKPFVEEAHPELRVDTLEEQKKSTFNMIIKKVRTS